MSHRTEVSVNCGAEFYTVHAGDGYWLPVDDGIEVFTAGDEVRHPGGGAWFPVPLQYLGMRYGCGCPVVMRRPLPICGIDA